MFTTPIQDDYFVRLKGEATHIENIGFETEINGPR